MCMCVCACCLRPETVRFWQSRCSDTSSGNTYLLARHVTSRAFNDPKECLKISRDDEKEVHEPIPSIDPHFFTVIRSSVFLSMLSG